MVVITNNSFLYNADLRFHYSEKISIQKLPGFKKHHQPPSGSGSVAQQFIGKLVSDELTSEFQHIHRLLRNCFNLKRKDIDVTIENGGSEAILESSRLRLQKSYLLSSENNEFVDCSVVLDSIPDLNSLTEPDFECGFPYRFHELQIAVKHKLDIEQMIDCLEENGSSESRFDLDYNFEGTTCEIRIPELTSALIFGSDKITVVGSKPRLGQELIRDFAVFQEILPDATVG